MASSTRGKRSAAAAAATQETGTPAKVARVGGAEPAVKDKAKKKGESDHHLHFFGCTPVPRGSTKGLKFRSYLHGCTLAAGRVWSSDHTCMGVPRQQEGSGVQIIPAWVYPGSTKGLEFGPYLHPSLLSQHEESGVQTIPAPQSLVTARRVWSSDHTCTPVSCGSMKGLEFRPYLYPSLLSQHEGSGVQTIPAPQSLVEARRVWSSDRTCTPVHRDSTKGLEFRPYLHPSLLWQHEGSGVQAVPAPQSLVAARRVWSSGRTCTPVPCDSTKGLGFRPYLHPSLLWQHEGSGVQTVPAPQSLVTARRVWSSDHACTPVSCDSTKGLEFRPYLHPSPLSQHEGSGVQTVPAPQSLVAARRVWSSDHTCTPVSRGSTKGLEFRPYLHPSLLWQHEGSGVQTIPAPQSLVAARRVWSSDCTCTPSI